MANTYQTNSAVCYMFEGTIPANRLSIQYKNGTFRFIINNVLAS